MQNLTFKKSGIVWLFLALLTTFSACVNDDPVSEEVRKNRNVNEWIQENMDVFYLWNNRMPARSNKDVYPANYFESLLYKTEDRFSYIAEDYAILLDALNGVQMEAGYYFTLGRIEEKSSELVGVINYVKPNSPASQTALKRGDFFLTVNGTQLTIQNYQQLVNAMSAPHTLGMVEGDTIKSVSLTVSKYEENPVLLDTVYTLGGKKIAYLVLNFFATDKGDNSYTYLKELNAIFRKYKQADVNEFILDLRHNSGGVEYVATALASMISNRTSTDLFCIDQYNLIVEKELKARYGDDYNKTFFDDYLMIRNNEGKIIDQSTPLNKLSGLNRFYVLTSDQTASASELVINGLTPYMEVVLIGETTYGKNVGMTFFYEEDPQKQRDNRWGMLPIIVKVFNSQNQSDYTNGFNPDVEANEYAAMPWLPLGDTHEFLLEKALAHIGVQQESAVRSSAQTIRMRPLLSSIDRIPVRKNLITPVFPSKIFR